MLSVLLTVLCLLPSPKYREVLGEVTSEQQCVLAVSLVQRENGGTLGDGTLSKQPHIHLI